MKFMTLWTDDWIAGTHPLTPEQRGVYITLICHFTNKDRVVLDDDIYLARLCNITTRAYRRVKKTLVESDHIEVRDGHIWIARTSQQYEKDQSYSKKQAEKAKLKARYEKANKLKSNENDSAGALPYCTRTLTHKESKKNGARYVYEGKIIKLNAADFKQWESSFEMLDIKAELCGLDLYYSGLPPDQVGNWFRRTGMALAKKNRELTAARKTAEKDEYKDFI